MYKVLIALKSQQQFKCSVTMAGKTKVVTLPQTEGLTFNVNQLGSIQLKYNDEVFKIQMNEDITETTGEYKFSNVIGQYYIVLIQDVEKPSKLNIKQNAQTSESPLRKNETERSLTASAKKFTFKTPTNRQKSESNQKLIQSFVLGDNLMEQLKQENKELKQRIIELENQVISLQEQNEQKNEKVELPKQEISSNDFRIDFQNLLKLQQRQAQENKQLLKQLMDLDTNYQELLDKKSLVDQEVTKLKQTISQFDCQITQLKSRLTQFEIDGLSQNIQLNLQIAQPIENDEIIDNLIKQILKMRATGSQYIPIKEDKLDSKLAQLIAKDHTQQYQFIRLKQGLYLIGEEQYQLFLQEQKIMITTEEGALQLQDFIKSRKRVKSINVRKP
ncbi:unnamed protein product (macronuclear) [Paramecium tetraurelia]|uniref:Uncharacterized protein n=1 Tax=Paramecium tetraurelia TaxID=5888 RepID=A0C7P8_PARTE|nr:uncharacterized protein GSPATT00035945001 [Paramecium tetraurelia]CAK66815.1 unnamed protein product [Paramecium tetraurelia]|eukprot:XP_001434212.1 hypothetical protein (macronuclear) [Paramecium tetraurelia strain d4-2]